MGSINAFEKSRLGGRPPGKITASLNEKLQNIEWGEYKLGDLFEIENTLSFNTDKLVSGTEYDYVTRTSLNQGILQTTGFINEENINPSGTWSLGLLQMDFFYRKKPWYAGQFVRKITPKIAITDSSILFFSTLLNKQKQRLLSVLVRDVDKVFLSTKIQLPTHSGKIDFDFMESFVAELEAQRVAELEAYLSVTGLKDTHLSFEEEQALLNFNKITFDEYKLTDVFDIKNAGNILSKDIVENSGKTPYLCASSENNAVSSYISYKDELKTKGNCIFIGGKTFVVTYQESDFFSNDSHNLALYLKEAEYQNKYTQMYLAACVNKSLNHKYTWGNSISNKKAQKDYISLPTKDEKIDFNSMSTLISAIQKLVIKDVVRYADKKIEKTKEAINSNTN